MEEFQSIIDLLQTKDVIDFDCFETETPETPKKEANLSDEEFSDIENTVLELMTEYIHNESIHYSNPDFHENMINDIVNILFEDYKDSGIFDDENEIENIVKTASSLFFEINDIPRRSQFYILPDTSCPPSEKWENEQNLVYGQNNQNNPILANQILQLQSQLQPDQRTKEWYEYRYNLITASSIWKIFSSDAQQNSLIYEKCKPFDMQQNSAIYGSQNTENSLHWGIKYEPLTIMLYEKMNNTKVGEFGCIQHKKYPFLGASPDGINVKPDSDKFGIMVEVKNIVNREITGIPSEAYWIQMQIQMETCDLPECDFIETRFKEYENEEQFYGDTLKPYKGVILYFIKKSLSDYHYEYMPLDIELTKEKIEEWITQKRAELKDNCSLYKTQYWYLDQYSCVLVERNRFWFESAIPKIENFWKTIEKERITGYEHRAPKKRANSFDTENLKNVCIVKLEEFSV